MNNVIAARRAQAHTVVLVVWGGRCDHWGKRTSFTLQKYSWRSPSRGQPYKSRDVSISDVRFCFPSTRSDSTEKLLACGGEAETGKSSESYVGEKPRLRHLSTVWLRASRPRARTCSARCRRTRRVPDVAVRNPKRLRNEPLKLPGLNV